MITFHCFACFGSIFLDYLRAYKNSLWSGKAHNETGLDQRPNYRPCHFRGGTFENSPTSSTTPKALQKLYQHHLCSDLPIFPTF